ncbi:hypothetical protein HK102_000285 [Quaeritorhiza haematococci]|nr:hypothetical protein HK102_000285 [Quaeritorhiza haematococci]
MPVKKKPPGKSAKPGGKSKGKGKKNMSKKKKGGGAGAADGDEDEINLRVRQLKRLKEEYERNCKQNLTEPLFGKRIDKALAAVEHIDKMIINSETLTVNDVRCLTKTFQSYSHLTHFCLWMVKLDHRGLEVLAQFLSAHPHISTLNLIDCGINTSMASSLRIICRNMPTLSLFVVDHNPLGSLGAAEVFMGIQERRTVAGGGAMATIDTGGTRKATGASTSTLSTGVNTITKCSMRYCNAGPECAQQIANALAVVPSLSELDLAGNEIGDEGLIPLAQALRFNQTLTVLSLAANEILDRHGLPVLPNSRTEDSFPKTTSQLSSLSGIPESSEDNHFRSTVANFCHVLATSNTGLASLDLRGNHFENTRAPQYIIDMLKTRKQQVVAKKAVPLTVNVTERMPEALFEQILDLNGDMLDLKKKMQKGGGKKKKS